MPHLYLVSWTVGMAYGRMLVLAESKEKAEEIAWATKAFKIEADKSPNAITMKAQIVPEAYFLLGPAAKGN